MNAIGVDVSKYNLGWDPDKAIKPIDFVIQRASWAGYKDERFDLMYQQVAKLPIRGAYHYYSSAVHWRVQADLFLSVTAGKGFHFFVLDYEGAYNNLNGRTIAEASEFVKYIKAQTGRRCLIYFSPNIYNLYVKPYGFEAWANQQDVWIAQYPWTLTQEPPYKAPKLPAGLTKWNIWQYGGGDVNFTAGRHAGPDYGGGTAGIDLNYFNGTADEMLTWCAADGEPVEPPIVDQAAVIGWLKPRYVANGPAIIAGSDAPKANHPTIALGAAEQGFIKQLNNFDAGVWRLFTAPDVGPTKGINSNGKMVYIVAGWSGNVVKIIGRAGGWVKVESINLAKGLPLPSDVNHASTPHLVHRMTTVNAKGQFIAYPMGSAWNKADDPLLSTNGEFWIPVEWVLDVATVKTSLYVRSGPGKSYAAVGALNLGQRITVKEMARDSAGNKWGRIGEGRWSCLEYQGTAYVDWILK